MKSIKSVLIHWSESCFINDFHADDNFDIEKEFSIDEAEKIIGYAAQLVDHSGYDKTK